MTYFVLATIKADLSIASTDTADDNLINGYGADSDSEIDDFLAPYMNVPLSSPPQNVILMSNTRCKGRYYEHIHQYDMAKEMWAQYRQLKDDYIRRLEMTKTAQNIPQYSVKTTGNIFTST